jgi:hypothetical protein
LRENDKIAEARWGSPEAKNTSDFLWSRVDLLSMLYYLSMDFVVIVVEDVSEGTERKRGGWAGY